MQMAELALLPAVRAADTDTLIVADGTSCRHQIADGTRRQGPAPPCTPSRCSHERSGRQTVPLPKDPLTRDDRA